MQHSPAFYGDDDSSTKPVIYLKGSGGSHAAGQGMPPKHVALAAVLNPVGAGHSNRNVSSTKKKPVARPLRRLCCFLLGLLQCDGWMDGWMRIDSPLVFDHAIHDMAFVALN